MMHQNLTPYTPLHDVAGVAFTAGFLLFIAAGTIIYISLHPCDLVVHVLSLSTRAALTAPILRDEEGLCRRRRPCGIWRIGPGN